MPGEPYLLNGSSISGGGEQQRGVGVRAEQPDVGCGEVAVGEAECVVGGVGIAKQHQSALFGLNGLSI